MTVANLGNVAHAHFKPKELQLANSNVTVLLLFL